jgi:hypothetical protein
MKDKTLESTRPASEAFKIMAKDNDERNAIGRIEFRPCVSVNSSCHQSFL